MRTSPKKKTAFFCTECGAMHLRWQGQCKECGAWNSLQEEKVVAPSRKSAMPSISAKAVLIPEISGEQDERIKSGVNEFDRTLGGGAVAGSALLIGGEPGIGKSSLLLQAAEGYSRQGINVLYVSGEESASQIKSRSARFGMKGENIAVANTTELEEILNLAATGYQVVIIDSVQTTATSSFDSPPGTVGQVRESAARLIEATRRSNSILFLVGHITKEGMVAGPKVLEHMVDAVLYFEGDRQHLFRLLRAQKNRFGPAGEIGVFEMTARGLAEAANPSRVFMSGDNYQPAPGRVIASAMEGSRSYLVEVEALVVNSPYGMPQRVASGLDSRRLAIINAVLEKRGGIPLGGHDVFVNIAGGMRLDDTALDLAFLTAAASSKLNLIVPGDMVIIGEIGLAGDVRGVSHLDRRLLEAARLGLKRAVVPRSNMGDLNAPDKMEILPVAQIGQALEIIR